MNIFDDIERDFGLRLGDPALDMVLVFDPETRSRAEALEAPGQLKIILPEALPEDLRKGLGRRVGKCLCLLFGKRQIIADLKSEDDYI